MLKPILRPILKSILQPVLSASTDLTRWVWTLNGMSYGTFSRVELGSDFLIQVDITFFSSQYDQLLLGNTGSYSDYLKLKKDGSILVSFSGAAVSTSANLILNNENYRIQLRRVGNQVDLILNGTTVNTSATNGGAPFFNALGRWAGVSNMSAIKSLLVEGITNQTYTSLNYKLNKPYSDPYFFTDSDNGIVMSTFNVLAEDVTEESV